MSARATGTVRTPSGWPVDGARVTLIDPAGGQLGRTMSDAEGAFALDGIAPGVATLLVSAPGHEPAARMATIAPGATDLGVVQLVRTGVAEHPAPGIWTVDVTHSSIEAKARHFGLSSVRGGFEDFGGVITVREPFEQSSTHVQIAARSVSTRNNARDEHLRSPDFLDVQRFPYITYTSDRVERQGEDWLVRGRLTMAGTTRPTDLTMTYHGSGPDPWGGTRAGFSATTVLRREDFDMRWNQAVALGIDALGTTLTVDIEIEAVLQQDG